MRSQFFGKHARRRAVRDRSPTAAPGLDRAGPSPRGRWAALCSVSEDASWSTALAHTMHTCPRDKLPTSASSNQDSRLFLPHRSILRCCCPSARYISIALPPPELSFLSPSFPEDTLALVSSKLHTLPHLPVFAIRIPTSPKWLPQSLKP